MSFFFMLIYRCIWWFVWKWKLLACCPSRMLFSQLPKTTFNW